MSDGTSFTIDLPVTGAGAVDAAAASVDTLAARLGDMSKASAAASDAVKAGEAAYKASESTADRAAKALEKVTLAMAEQKKIAALAIADGETEIAAQAEATLARLNARQTEAATKADAARDAMNAQAAALDNLKAAAVTAADAEKAVGEELDKAKEAAEEAAKAKGSGKANEAAEALGKLGGPLGRLGQQAFGAKAGVDKLFASLGSSAGPLIAAVGFAALAAAVLAVGVALAVGAVAAVKWAVGLADANRTQALLSQGIAQSVAGGAQLDATIRKLGGQVPQTREELSQMASQLAATGLRGKDLSVALEAAAVKAAKLKYGPDFAKETLSLDRQVQRLHENIASTFGGLKIDGLLSAFSKLVALFDDTTVSGQAIKAVFNDLFQPLIDGAKNFIPTIERAFIKLEILVLKGLIQVKQLGGTFKAWAPYLDPIWTGLKLIGEALGVVAVLAVAGVALFVAPFIALGAAAIYAVGVIGQFVVGAYTTVVDLWTKVTDFFSGISLADIGSQLIAGLAAGITGGAAAVVDSVSGAVHGAIDTAKDLLGIHSPSKVFAEIGGYTAEGMAEGVKGGTSSTQSALESLVSPPATQASGSAKPGGTSSGNTFNVTITAANVTEAANKFADMLLQVFEGDVTQIGAAVPNAT